MAPRSKRRRCRNCPDVPMTQTPPSEIVDSEGKKLWQHAVYSCNNTIEMMAGYVAMGIFGNKSQLQHLAERLNEIIKNHKE